jgi:predicted oxidoreductase (fatty acid repression mutant protein)
MTRIKRRGRCLMGEWDHRAQMLLGDLRTPVRETTFEPSGDGGDILQRTRL